MCVKKSGFSILELLIVIVIIGVLAAIASASYRNYVLRSKVTQQFGYARPAKTIIEAFYNAEAQLPMPNDINGKITPGSSSGEIGFNNGKFKVFYTKHESGSRVLLKIEKVDEVVGCDSTSCSTFMVGVIGNYKTVDWHCGPWNIPETDDANVDQKFLPASCKVKLSDCYQNGNCS